VLNYKQTHGSRNPAEPRLGKVGKCRNQSTCVAEIHKKSGFGEGKYSGNQRGITKAKNKINGRAISKIIYTNPFPHH